MMRIFTFIFIIIIFINYVSSFNHNHPVVSDDYQPMKQNDKCEKITMKMCSDIPYNLTFYPNALKHQSQSEAEEDIKQFDMLVNVKCSPDVKFFLCTLYTPVCTQMDYPLLPCKHLCLSAKNGCEELMKKFGYSWPEMLNCNKFPENGMCVGENKTNSEDDENNEYKKLKNKKKSKKELECPHGMKILSKSRFYIKISNQTIEQCSLPCSDDSLVPLFFKQETRNQLRFWIGLFFVFSGISSILTLITFLVDLKRFEYPEKSILYLSFCTLIVSCVYIFGMVHEGGYSCSSYSVSSASLLTQGMDKFQCTLIAVIHYYFSTAMHLWWLTLCFSWFLVTTLKWGEAPVGRVFSAYFHIFTWGIPLILVIFVLVLNGIDGDMFASICSVGNLQTGILLNFVIIPQFVSLCIGFILFLIGLISIIRIRSYIKIAKFSSTVDASEKLFRLMIRMTVFALLFIIPTFLSLYSNMYQINHLESWLTTWYSTRCLHAQRSTFGFTQPREHCPLVSSQIQSDIFGILESSGPDPIFYFFKHLPLFVVGIACAVWTMNGKTLTSFKDCFDGMCHQGRSRVPTVDH